MTPARTGWVVTPLSEKGRSKRITRARPAGSRTPAAAAWRAQPRAWAVRRVPRAADLLGYAGLPPPPGGGSVSWRLRRGADATRAGRGRAAGRQAPRVDGVAGRARAWGSKGGCRARGPSCSPPGRAGAVELRASGQLRSPRAVGIRVAIWNPRGSSGGRGVLSNGDFSSSIPSSGLTALSWERAAVKGISWTGQREE